MGCETSSATALAVINAPAASTITDFTVVAQHVKQTWPDIQKISNLGAKTFAR